MLFKIRCHICGTYNIGKGTFFDFLDTKMKKTCEQKIKEKNVVGLLLNFKKGYCPKCAKEGKSVFEVIPLLEV